MKATYYHCHPRAVVREGFWLQQVEDAKRNAHAARERLDMYRLRHMLNYLDLINPHVAAICREAYLE